MRFLKLLWGDIRFQLKYGFYFLYAAFTVFYIFLLLLFSSQWKSIAGTIMIYSDPAALGLFFMGAIILLEKSENVINALVISPVKVSEYIVSKVLSLSIISAIVALFLAIVAGHDNILIIILTVVVTSAIFTLLGIIIGANATSLNKYLISTIPLQIILFIPPIVYLFKPISILRYHPLTSSIILLSGSSDSYVFDFISLIVIVLLLYRIAYKVTIGSWRKLGGVKL